MSEAWEKNWVRLPLEGAYNVRELGGYPASMGRPTLFHRFLRSDSLFGLTQADEEFLYGYGVRTVVDLRGDNEAAAHPDPQIGPDVAHVHVPLFDVNIAAEDDERDNPELAHLSAEQVYLMVLEKKEQIARCMRAFIDAPEGCVLFHCSAGKDRTGIVAYLLMSLAGCDRWDCLTSYIPSRINLMRAEWFIDQWHQEMTYEHRAQFDSRIETLSYAIEQVDSWGQTVAYLHDCGLDYMELAKLRTRMLKD
ncbi:MAG: tyrosine-protein phosphatase [Atopobiaceae bacterium]|nr:tyrosine-protein phosphatase [Atopobiaceae bacterium]